MNLLSIRTLIRREFWEHKGLLLKTPLVISMILVVLTAIGTYKAVSFAPWGSDSDTFKYEHNDGSSFRLNPGDNLNFENNTKRDKQQIGKIRSTVASGIAGIALIFSFLLSLYYLSQSLYQDRKDKSILFWRSLPINEWETIASKLITGMWVFPLVFSGFAFAATLICLIVIYIGASLLGIESMMQGLVFEVEGYSITALIQFILKALLFTTSLLPIYCWLLFSSAYSKKSPMLVAIGVPIAIIIAESIALHSTHFALSLKSLFTSLYMNTDAVVNLKIGYINWKSYIIMLISSCALLVGTYWLRNNRYEI